MRRQVPSRVGAPLAAGGGGGAGLEALGQGNVTLLELSGQEFLVDRIVRAEQLIDQRSVYRGVDFTRSVSVKNPGRENQCAKMIQIVIINKSKRIETYRRKSVNGSS